MIQGKYDKKPERWETRGACREQGVFFVGSRDCLPEARVPAGNKDEYFSRKQRRVYAKFYASQIPLFLICGIYNATFLA